VAALRRLRLLTHGYDQGYKTARGYKAAITIGETAPHDVALFESWVYECRIQRAKGFVLNNNSGMMLDVCVSTRTDVPVGLCVLYVPKLWILSSSKAMAELRTADLDQAEKARYSRIASCPPLYILR
jgi:hypothetical protein